MNGTIAQIYKIYNPIPYLFIYLLVVLLEMMVIIITTQQWPCMIFLHLHCNFLNKNVVHPLRLFFFRIRFDFFFRSIINIDGASYNAMLEKYNI